MIIITTAKADMTEKRTKESKYFLIVSFNKSFIGKKYNPINIEKNSKIKLGITSLIAKKNNIEAVIGNKNS